METNLPSFRDRPLNIDENGKRKWIYARQPKGIWYTRRTIVAWIFFAFLVLAPIVKINSNPLMLFDIVNRRFSLFGQIIWAQDTYILALIMAVTVVFVVLFTVVFGRLWCGWACPQTIFLEMIYRRVEYLFEGNNRQKGVKPSKLKVITKHIAFIFISIIITHVFIMWFTGPEKLLEIITSSINRYPLGFMFMLAVSGAYYCIYAFLREQVCTMWCPYGRMQGVLLDSKSISVIYDYKRGEPRGQRDGGDCVNCSRCVAVCPTGIDIRNGSQLECINCTACIDECNQVMTKVKKPLNLIRYDSVYGVENGTEKIVNGRTISYSIVLSILLVVLSVVVSKRTAVDATILRMPGTLYQQIDSQTIANVYNAKVINKTGSNKKLIFKLIPADMGKVELATENNSIEANGSFENMLIIKLNKSKLSGKSTNISIGIYENDKLLEKLKTNFFGPSK